MPQASQAPNKLNNRSGEGMLKLALLLHPAESIYMYMYEQDDFRLYVHPYVIVVGDSLRNDYLLHFLRKAPTENSHLSAVDGFGKSLSVPNLPMLKI